jgi:hypothetical protein
MKRFVAAVFLAFLSFAASAITLEAAAPTIQFTVVGAAVPEPLAVVVRDDAGQPLAGVAVTFSVIAIPGETGIGAFPTDQTSVTVLTDASGVARPDPTVVALEEGTFTVVASSTVTTSSVTFLVDADAAELAVSELRVLSDDPAGFAVQALDAFGNPVPAAALEFCAPTSGPSGTFQGSNCILMTADENGIAIAPTFVTNGVQGQGEVIVTAIGTDASVAIRFRIKRGDSDGSTCKHDSKGGHKHDGKHPGKDC